MNNPETTDEMHGRIRIAVSTAQELQKLEHILRTSNISLGGDMVALELRNPKTLRLPVNRPGNEAQARQ